MPAKITVLLKDELSFSPVRNTLIQGMIHYGLLLFCLSILVKSDGSQTSQIQTLILIVVFNFILLSTLIPSYFEDDFSDGYITWLKGKDGMLRYYFLAKVLGGVALYIAPILLLSLGCFVLLGGVAAIDVIFPFFISNLLSLLTVLCWGSLFQLLIGGSNLNKQGSLGTSLLSLLLLPLLIPTFLVGWEWINVLVRGEYWGYYLGMQGGLFMASLAAGLGLAPLIIKHTEF